MFLFLNFSVGFYVLHLIKTTYVKLKGLTFLDC